MFSVSFKNRVKNSHLIYNLYYYVGSFFVQLLRLFVKGNDKLILFVCYGGKYFDDSPRDIYECMLKDPRFSDFQLVWAFENKHQFDIKGGRKITIDTLEYFKTALKARVWITNVNIKRGLNFKGINTLSVNSWHGSALKKIGADSLSMESFRSKASAPLADLMLAQGMNDVIGYSSAFGLSKEDIIITGFPRNDTLVDCNNLSNICKIKKKLGIPEGKKVILYAPTYRDYERIDGRHFSFHPQINLNRWQELFKNDYVLLIRAHMAVAKVWGIEENQFVKNVSSYPIVNDILLVSDLLISDYSGIIFDFSILGRPMICYAYDYDQYCKMRGLYMDIRKDMPYVQNEDQLISAIKNMNYEDMCEKTIRFREKFIQKYGNSSQRVVDLIHRKIEG